MHLYLTNNSPFNTTLIDDSGEERYSVETPNRWTRRTTTILKVPQLTYPQLYSSSVTFCELPEPPDTPTSDLAPLTFTRGVDKFPFGNELAQIQWRMISNSRLKFAGIESDFQDYLVRSGAWGRLRTFTAPDGQSYQWSMCLVAPVLCRSDGDKAPIARFHPRRVGFPGLWKGRDACLEILPAGEHIVDAIVMTFIYVEKRRRDKARLLRTVGG